MSSLYDDVRVETPRVEAPARSGRASARAARLISRARAAFGRSWPARHWTTSLASLGVLLWGLTVVAFYPGFMSTDSVQQFGQALDPAQLNDWHPPVMTALWWLFLQLPLPEVGSMLALQVTALWAALVLLAIYVHRRSGSRPLSLLPLALGVLPVVVNIAGVIWKDDHLAFALLGAVVATLYARRAEGAVRSRRAALIVAVLLLVYAGAVRYNALPAIVPLLFLLRPAGRLAGGRGRAVLGVAVVVGAFLVTPVIGLLHPVQATNPSASIMLDDVVHVYPVAELRAAEVSPDLKQWLATLEENCPPPTMTVDYTWACQGSDAIPPFFVDHYGELRGLYLHGILEHPLRYLKYRATVYAHFLNPSAAESFVWWMGIDSNPYGLGYAPHHLTGALQGYVNFTFSNFGFLYKPYFWLLAGLAVLGIAWRNRGRYEHAGTTIALAVSALLYVVTYVPMVIGFDYRYIYWSVIAICVAAILLVVDRARSHRDLEDDVALQELLVSAER